MDIRLIVTVGTVKFYFIVRVWCPHRFWLNDIRRFSLAIIIFEYVQPQLESK